jgi:hypothetical protein
LEAQKPWQGERHRTKWRDSCDAGDLICYLAGFCFLATLILRISFLPSSSSTTIPLHRLPVHASSMAYLFACVAGGLLVGGALQEHHDNKARKSHKRKVAGTIQPFPSQSPSNKGFFPDYSTSFQSQNNGVSINRSEKLKVTPTDQPLTLVRPPPPYQFKVCSLATHTHLKLN